MLQSHHVRRMTVNVGGLIMAEKERWLAEIPFTVPAALKETVSSFVEG